MSGSGLCALLQPVRVGFVTDALQGKVDIMRECGQRERGKQCSVRARASIGLSRGRDFCTYVELSSVLTTRTRLAPLSAV
eukprot:scaffold13889_cov160-Isochrysis_galbana.AAC.1